MKKLLYLFVFISYLSFAQDGGLKTLIATGPANSYIISEALPATYNQKERFQIIFPVSNTGASTINRAGLGLKDIRKSDGSALSSGDITAGNAYFFSYSSANGYYVCETCGGSVGGGGITALTGGVTASGSGSVVATVVTNANLSGDVSSVGNTTTYAGTVPINKGGTNLTTLGTALQGLQVNSGATGLEYYTKTTNPTTSIGDIVYVNAVNLGVGSFARLGIGTASQQLRVNAGATALEYFTPSASTSVFSGLTAATGTNTIDNAAFANEWQWNTLGAGTGLRLTSTSTAAASNTQKIFEVAKSGANAGQTTHAGYFTNTSTGVSAINIAGYFSASGATSNASIVAPSGNAVFGSSSFLTSNRVTINGVAGNNILNLLSSGGSSRYSISDDGLITHTTVSRSSGGATYGLSGTWNAASGTNTFTQLSLTPTISTTGAYVGVGYILDINPTLSSVIGYTNHAIRATSGKVLIGKNAITTSTKMDLVGDGTSTGNTLRLANSSDVETFAFKDVGGLSVNGSQGTNGQVLTSGGAGNPSSWSTPITYYAPTTLVANATDANFTATANGVHNILDGVATSNRVITIPTGANGDVMKFYNTEDTYIWSFTGETVYLADRVTVQNSLLYNVPCHVEKVDGRWIIVN